MRLFKDNELYRRVAQLEEIVSMAFGAKRAPYSAPVTVWAKQKQCHHRELILAVMCDGKERGVGRITNDCTKLAGTKQNKSSINVKLSNMVQSGELVRIEKGLYRIAANAKKVSVG